MQAAPLIPDVAANVLQAARDLNVRVQATMEESGRQRFPKTYAAAERSLQNAAAERSLQDAAAERSLQEDLHRCQSRRDLGWALGVLRTGGRVTRRGWNGKGQTLELRHLIGYAPAIVLRTPKGEVVFPWVCSATDLLAEDYCLPEEAVEETAAGGTFVLAMQRLARGWDVRRKAWPAAMWLQHPSDNDETPQLARVQDQTGRAVEEPWLPTVADTQATDWCIAETLHCRQCGESFWRHTVVAQPEHGVSECRGLRSAFAPRERAL